jgi:hypothetical protein
MSAGRNGAVMLAVLSVSVGILAGLQQCFPQGIPSALSCSFQSTGTSQGFAQSLLTCSSILQIGASPLPEVGRAYGMLLPRTLPFVLLLLAVVRLQELARRVVGGW